MVNDIFNLKVYHYPNSTQVRLYENVVISEDDLQVNEFTGEVYRKERNKRNFSIDDFNPFTGAYEPVESIPEDWEERQRRSKQVSMARTINDIYYKARSNTWDYFLTLTINSDIDRYDYATCYKTVTKYFYNLRSRYVPDMKFLIVPEQHKDGAWHFHGVLSNVPDDMVFDSGLKDKNGRSIYNLLYHKESGKIIYEKGAWKHGFNTLTKVSGSEQVSKYICKYITKSSDGIPRGKRRYFASNNLDAAAIETVMVDFSRLRNVFEKLPDVQHMSNVRTAYNNVKYIELGMDFDIQSLKEYFLYEYE